MDDDDDTPAELISYKDLMSKIREKQSSPTKKSSETTGVYSANPILSPVKKPRLLCDEDEMTKVIHSTVKLMEFMNLQTLEELDEKLVDRESEELCRAVVGSNEMFRQVQQYFFV